MIFFSQLKFFGLNALATRDGKTTINYDPDLPYYEWNGSSLTILQLTVWPAVLTS